jgi:catechol 2,3-dioxygenase-like lactoylglutathione lyase family enzyme
MDLRLNWLGLSVADFDASLRFYTEVLGMSAKDATSDWAFLETTGMTLELSSGGMPPAPERAWGRGQAIRPSIHVADLQATIEGLRRKGVAFSSDIERSPWGEQIEFMAPERIRWTLAHAPAYPFGSTLEKPHVGWVAMKVHRLVEQRAFYRDVMGLQAEDRTDGRVIFLQGRDEPRLLLEQGGEEAPPLQVSQGVLRPAPPHMLSFETDNIQQAAVYLKAQGVRFVLDVTRREWGGTDLLITDVDGNPIQVVQYRTAACRDDPYIGSA